MKQSESSSRTIRLFVLLIISVCVGTFFSNQILGNLGINVWICRGIGAGITVVMTLLLDWLLIRRSRKKQREK